MQALVAAAQNTFPHEFIALLGRREKKGSIIDEFIVLPATFGETFSSIRLDLLPYTSGAIGSVHSHPGPSASPSMGDLAAFGAMGEIHLIIAFPFSFESTRAFDASGKQIAIEIVE